MDKTTQESVSRHKQRRPGSFVWKLTFRQTMRMLGMLIAVDLILVLLWSAVVLVNVEQIAAGIASASNSEETVQQINSVFNLSIEQVENTRGVGLNWRIEQELGIQEGSLRYLEWPLDQGIHSLWNQAHPVYTIYMPKVDNTYLALSFDLTTLYYQMRIVLTMLLCLEGILLVSSIFSTTSSVRAILRPIQELTMVAQTIDTESRRAQSTQDVRQELALSGTIDTLNTITAKHLDTRIPTDSERQELQGLASAINSMLDRLDAAYRSQLRFVSDASHELRTPIAVIQGYANLLDRWGKDDPTTLQESVMAIKSETESMQALVEQLLFLARSDNNSIVLDLQAVDVSKLAQEVIKSSQLIAPEHTFVLDVQHSLYVLADSGLIKQALRIFVDNAVKYSPVGSAIRVEVKSDGPWVKVSVTDEGIGIPEEDLPHVFERFYRSDESRARKTGGTGLGLAIAKWTVQRHGGHMDILSRKDIGTRLTIKLPVAVEQELPFKQAQ